MNRKLYVILDLHAVQGWQSAGWHCDNATGMALFWGQKVFEDRAVALWEELARRYRDEPFVAGYNVMNEPDCADAKWLNRFYRRVTQAIREIDSDHILFLEGNHYSQQFHELEPPFDNNTVYSSHYYTEPGLDAGEYPGEFGGVFYDRERVKAGYLPRTEFMRQHQVPHWLGEFGCIYTDESLEDSCLRVMADLLDIAEEHPDHWTIWTYKDIGKMGLVYAASESAWMQRTRPVRKAKTALRCDSWIERHDAEISRLIAQVSECVQGEVAGLAGDWPNLAEVLMTAICDGTLSQCLLPAFAEQFRDMSEVEIDEMMQSFAFENCVQRTGLVELIRRRCSLA
jgi:endoglucanase